MQIKRDLFIIEYFPDFGIAFFGDLGDVENKGSFPPQL